MAMVAGTVAGGAVEVLRTDHAWVDTLRPGRLAPAQPTHPVGQATLLPDMSRAGKPPPLGAGKLAARRYLMANGLDHGEVIHHAGRHGLSPALQDGGPALVAHGAPGQRCGWAPFFAALSARGETLALASDGGCRTVPLAETPSRPSAPAAFLHGAVATLRALRGPSP